MWNAILSVTNLTDYSISFTNTFLPVQVLSPYTSESWDILQSPNTSSFKFWKINEDTVEFQGGIYFGEDCGVWADRGYMEVPTVIMDAEVNGVVFSQELNGGQTIVEDFSAGGNISLVFRI